MLLLKKRYPKRKLFTYGGAAFISSFVLATSVMASTNVQLEDFMAASPTQESSIGKDASQDTTSEPAGAPLDTSQEATSQSSPQPASSANDTTWTTPTYRQQPTEAQSPAPSAQPQPAQTQPSTPPQPAEEPTPSQPASPTDPTDEPAEEEPGIIDDVVEIIDPTNP